MKKVCFLISNNLTRDNRTIRQIQALSSEGYDVKVICTKAGEDLPTEESENGFTIFRVLDGWLPIAPRNKLEFQSCKRFMSFVVREKADIYICKDLDTLLYGWRAVNKHKSKLVYNADEYWQGIKLDGLSWKTNLYFKLYFFFAERFFIRWANLVIAVNEALATKMKSLLFLKKKPMVILNAPEKIKISVNDELIKDSGFSGKDIVIYPGVFSEGRGLENLVLAAKYLPQNIAIVLLGYGNLKNKLEILIRSEDLDTKVKILDAVPGDRLLSYISSAKLGIIPIQPTSTSHKYCLPNKFFEYILAGLPICTSDLPVIGDLVRKYEIGETFNSYSVEDLAKTVKMMLYNRQKYVSYKKNLQRAANDLNWGNEKKKYLKAISEL